MTAFVLIVVAAINAERNTAVGWQEKTQQYASQPLSWRVIFLNFCYSRLMTMRASNCLFVLSENNSGHGRCHHMHGRCHHLHGNTLYPHVHLRSAHIDLSLWGHHVGLLMMMLLLLITTAWLLLLMLAVMMLVRININTHSWHLDSHSWHLNCHLRLSIWAHSITLDLILHLHSYILYLLYKSLQKLTYIL